LAGADLGVFATEIDKSGFKGSVRNNKIFKDWNRDNTFANVMDKAQDIGLKAIAKLSRLMLTLAALIRLGKSLKLLKITCVQRVQCCLH
jgi:hypothetical protein